MSPIKEIEIVNIIKQINKVKLDHIIFIFDENKYAVARLYLLDSTDEIIKTVEVVLTKQDLDEWGEDDSILMDLILNAKNITELV